MTFSIGSTISKAWTHTKANMGFLIVATAIYGIVTIILGAGSSKDHRLISLIFWAVSRAIELIFLIGMIKVSFAILDGVKPDKNMFMPDWKVFWTLFWAIIIISCISVAGFILLIIPGIYVAVRFGMTSYIIVDRKSEAWLSIKESWKMTKGNWWKLFGFGLSLGIIMLISMIPLFLGLLVSIPLATIASALVYRQLSNINPEMPQVVIEPTEA